MQIVWVACVALPNLYKWGKLVDQDYLLDGWPELVVLEFCSAISRFCPRGEDPYDKARVLNEEVIQLAICWMARDGCIRVQVMRGAFSAKTNHYLHIRTKD